MNVYDHEWRDGGGGGGGESGEGEYVQMFERGDRFAYPLFRKMSKVKGDGGREGLTSIGVVLHL